jgi:hypothetical protein
LGCGLLVLPHLLVWCPRARRSPHLLGSSGKLGGGFIGIISEMLGLTIIRVRHANLYWVLRIFVACTSVNSDSFTTIPFPLAATSSWTSPFKMRYFAFHGVFGLFELLCKTASQTTAARLFRACATICTHSLILAYTA